MKVVEMISDCQTELKKVPETTQITKVLNLLYLTKLYVLSDDPELLNCFNLIKTVDFETLKKL